MEPQISMPDLLYTTDVLNKGIPFVDINGRVRE